MNQIILADNLEYLKTIPDNSIDLIFTDPPYNIGHTQKRPKISAKISENGLAGFGGNKYDRNIVGQYGSFEDNYDNFIDGFLKPRMIEAHRVLKNNGSFYVIMDYHEVHYLKVCLDGIFGRDNFLGEIIWSFEWGAKSKKKWSMKHNTILCYVKDKKNYTFNYDKVPRVKYKAPELAGKEKAAKGKTICSVWWNTIVGTNSKEKQGYATQKPIAILKPLIEVSSNPGDLVMDPFSGSGSFGMAAAELGRRFIMIDNNPQAAEIMERRLKEYL